MGLADIQTTMLYVHHVPQHDAADKLSAALSATCNESRTVSIRQTVAPPADDIDAEIAGTWAPRAKHGDPSVVSGEERGSSHAGGSLRTDVASVGIWAPDRGAPRIGGSCSRTNRL